MEIYVQAWARKVISHETKVIGTAYFTFVALDENASPVPVHKVKPTTDEEKNHYKEAHTRKGKKKPVKPIA